MISRVAAILRELVQRRRAHREVDEELQFHIEMETAANITRGLSPAEARRRALADLGGVTQTRESVRAVRASWLDTTAQDLRFGVRLLGAGGHSGWAAVTMLAVAIGITAAMFTITDALLLRPVPFTDPETLAFVYMGNERGGRTTVHQSVLREWRASGVLAGAEAASAQNVVVDLNGLFVSRNFARVTPGLFDLLGGVQPIRGRLFEPQEGSPGADDRILISEVLWTELLGRDPAAVGRTLVLDRRPCTIVGILPSEFRFPNPNTMIWRADSFAGAASGRPSVYVRFRSDLPRADAERMATDVARAADPANAKGQLVLRTDEVAGLDSHSQGAVRVLAGGVILVFVVLCANVSSLLLARLASRQREFAMRSALGASRARLLRQVLVESALMGALAIAAGAALAWALVATARALLPDAFLLRTLNPLDLDLRALAVTAGAGVVATVVAGALPALIGTRLQTDSALRIVDRGGTESRPARLLTRTLLVTELALACTLLIGATVLVRSFLNLAAAERGLAAEGVLTISLSVSSTGLPDDVARASVSRALEDDLRALPGIRQVAWSYGLPPEGGALSWGEWTPDGAPAVNLVINRYWVGADFFSLYDVPLLSGRPFEPSDPATTTIVSERFAAALWPGQDPVGRSFQYGKEVYEVIGVAREIAYPTLETRRDTPEIYLPFRGVGQYAMAMASIRCDGGCPDPALIRHRLSQTHASIRVENVRPLLDSYLEQLARPRAAAALGFTFAAVAVLAAAGGLFSVLSYAVGRRRREFGIRAALGASASQQAREVVREGLTVTSIGLTLGIAAAWWLTRGLSALQYGVTPWDPTSGLVVLAVLLTTVALASWRPAREAMKADPVALLRED
jgi:predicted permease